MNLSQKLIYLFVFCIFTTSSYSNTLKQDSILSISGRIVNIKNSQPVSLATVTIKRSRRGNICDSLGIFHLQVQQSDTLLISALGYKPKKWAISSHYTPEHTFFTIKLETVSYMLDEVAILNWRNWSEFKEEFIKEEVPVEVNMGKTCVLSKEELKNINDKLESEKAGNIIGGLIYYGAKLFERKKEPEIIYTDHEKEFHQQILKEKFNNKVIQDLTHESGDRLKQVCIYINSKTSFTFKDSEFTVQSRIMELYKEFKSNPEILDQQSVNLESAKIITNHIRP